MQDQKVISFGPYALGEEVDASALNTSVRQQRPDDPRVLVGASAFELKPQR
jgi:hypothetical protein